MSILSKYNVSVMAVLLASAGFLIPLATCTSTHSDSKGSVATGKAATTQATTAPTTTSPAWVWPYPAPARGSAELWSTTCSRCHNLRSPSAYSSDQWQVIMHDMRIRAQLTGQEQRQILEFLQSAH